MAQYRPPSLTPHHRRSQRAQRARPLTLTLLALSVTALWSCDDSSTPSSSAGVSAGGALAAMEAGASAGETAGSTAGEVAGEVAANAGEVAGEVAGANAGEQGGAMGGDQGGVMGGATPPASTEDLALNELDPSLIDMISSSPASSDPRCAELALLYPETGTVIPSNLFGMSFQWARLAQGPYVVTARSGALRVRWVTSELQMTPDGLTWERLKRSSGGGAIEWKVSALLEGARCDSERREVEVDPSELLGAVYYWSTTDGGIMRLAAGEREPEPLLTPATAPELNCPACHALSRDGRRIAFTRTSFPPFGDLATSLIDEPRQLLYDTTGVEGYFPSFSPNPDYLAAGSSGRLIIRHSETGEELNHLTLPPMTVAGVPDWSWQGDRIVGVVGPTGLMNFLPNEGINLGSLYEWVKVNDEAGEPGSDPSEWGEPQLLVPQVGDLSNDRPAYDPTGQLIAFNMEGSDPTAGEGQGNRNVSLWMIRVGEPNPTPVELARANMGELQGNSWPKWAPTDRRGRLWLAFSSFRSYGHALPDNPNGERRPQIWVTAIDPNAPLGVDPSAPAFWLPFQNTNSGNHIPYWAAYEKR